MSGIAAEFDREATLVAATERLRREGFARIEAYAPYPVEALDAVLPPPARTLPVLVFLAGCLGLAAGFAMEWYDGAVAYPIDIGGRPAGSWPAYIPIAFEIAALCATATAFFGFMNLARLPRPYQPIAAVPGFERASQDRFFLSIDDSDPRFDAVRLHALLEEFTPCSVAPWHS